jgi:hypothetical protein
VNVEHFDAQARRFHRRFGDRVGNIVKLEVEKNFPASFLNQPHRLRTGVGKKLFANFEHSHFRRQKPNQLPNVFETVDIEGDDQPLSHRKAGANQL